MNYSNKAFILTWFLFLILLSLVLTGAFYLTAHGNEFGSTTLTNSTSSTNSTTITTLYTASTVVSGITTLVVGCDINLHPKYVLAPMTVVCPPDTSPIIIFIQSSETTTNSTSSSSESSRVMSDYGQLGEVLVIILIAVLVIIAVLRRDYKK